MAVEAPQGGIGYALALGDDGATALNKRGSFAIVSCKIDGREEERENASLSPPPNLAGT